MQLAVSFITRQQLDPLQELQSLWDRRVGKLNMEMFVQHYFESKEKLIFNYDNLYDLGQQFARLFKVDELNNPYLHHLQGRSALVQELLWQLCLHLSK